MFSSPTIRRPARLIAGMAGAAALGVAGATTAAAHVGVSPGEAPAGSYAVLTFSVPHGCEGSPTTEIAIEIPEQILAVTPTINPNWDAEKLAADGSPAENGPVAEVVYTAKTPLPSDLRDALELSVRLPDEAGQTLAFPVVQTCEGGETAWDQIAEEGEDPHGLEAPAPLVEVTEPAEEHGGGHDDAEAASESDDDTAATVMSIAGLGAGILGLLLGATALWLVRRQARPQG